MLLVLVFVGFTIASAEVVVIKQPNDASYYIAFDSTAIILEYEFKDAAPLGIIAQEIPKSAGVSCSIDSLKKAVEDGLEINSYFDFEFYAGEPTQKHTVNLKDQFSSWFIRYQNEKTFEDEEYTFNTQTGGRYVCTMLGVITENFQELNHFIAKIFESNNDIPIDQRARSSAGDMNWLMIAIIAGIAVFIFLVAFSPKTEKKK
jgi:hypothetical protein